MEDLKAGYKTVMDDNFPNEMQIKFGNQTLDYKKRTWKIADGDQVVEKGLRYGENPGQEAALYEMVKGNLSLGDCAFIEGGKSLVGGVNEEMMIQFGKHPGKTNLTDIDNALNILKYLTEKPSCTIMKHNNPCGVAFADTISQAYSKANIADRIAAFGGCAALNRPVTKECAEMIRDNYLEVVVAPEYEEGAVEILQSRKTLRIVQIRKIDDLVKYRQSRFVDFKCLIDGSIVVQQSPLNRIVTKDDFLPAKASYKGEEFSIERQPTDAEYEDMLFGWSVEQGITSNSVIYIKDGVTVGIGTGEQDRVGVAEIAIYKAYTKYRDSICYEAHGMPFADLKLAVAKGDKARGLVDELEERTKQDCGGLPGSVMVSDAFFPFRDGVDVALREGVRAIVQPGGSMRDYEVIQACNESDPQATMVFTGQRCFKH